MRSSHGEFSRNNPLRRKAAIRNVKREYEQSERGKKTRLFNYEKKINFLLNVKVQLKCKDCKIGNPVLLNFHHRDREKKKFNLSGSNVCRSWKAIIEEIEKCDVLCFNCHFLCEDKKEHPQQGKKYQPRKKEIIYGIQRKLI